MQSSFVKKIILKIITIVFVLMILIVAGQYGARKTALLIENIQEARTLEATMKSNSDAPLYELSYFANIEGNEDSIRNAFPQADYIVPFTDSLQKAAEQSAVTIQTRFTNPSPTSQTLPAPQATGSPSIIYTINTSIQATGDARSLEKFLRAIHSLPYYFTIQSLTAKSENIQGGWEQAVTADIEAVLYTKNP